MSFFETNRTPYSGVVSGFGRSVAAGWQKVGQSVNTDTSEMLFRLYLGRFTLCVGVPWGWPKFGIQRGSNHHYWSLFLVRPSGPRDRFRIAWRRYHGGQGVKGDQQAVDASIRIYRFSIAVSFPWCRIR